ncbi:serine/threonine protein kinase [Maudiozyma humilis]|uniref:Serine/threonine protein kinase n=1 Tax=Maudiozyma humilis TaxID=51915 RepID=A0AAV5RV30_MAUHU|nr:serine/threonine protein kinase [Kazachstania humilis]
MSLGWLEPADTYTRAALPRPAEILPHTLLHIGRAPAEPSSPMLGKGKGAANIRMGGLPGAGAPAYTPTHLSLPSPGISALHCTLWGVRFDAQSEPQCYVRDDASRNGTRLNGAPLPRGLPCLLSGGDVLQLPAPGCASIQGRHPDVTGDISDITPDATVTAPRWFRLRFRGVAAPQTAAQGPEGDTSSAATPPFTAPAPWQITPRLIGSGTFGQVLVCTRGNSPTRYAVKVVTRRTGHAHPQTDAEREARILASLTHPNIVAVHCVHVCGPQLLLFQDLVCGGDLFAYLARSDRLAPLPEYEALVVVYQVLCALRYMHARGVVHRDLKLDNVLLAAPEPCARVVLADFGIARELASPQQRMHTVVGTPEYCAPEVGFGRVRGNCDLRSQYSTFSRLATAEQVSRYGYSRKCDLWSLGVLTHIVLTGVSPFYGDGVQEGMVQRAARGKLEMHGSAWEGVSADARGFVAGLLEVSEEQRCDAQGAMRLRWVHGHRGVLRRVYSKIVGGGDM